MVILALILPIVLPCKDIYTINENVTIYDTIETNGVNATCNISIYFNNSVNQSNWMVKNDLAYSYNAGQLSNGTYVANIECNKSTALYLAECKFSVSDEASGMYLAMILGLILVAGVFLWSTFTMDKKNTTMKLVSYFFAIFLSFSALFMAYKISSLSAIAGELTTVWNVILAVTVLVVIMLIFFYVIRLKKQTFENKEKKDQYGVY